VTPEQISEPLFGTFNKFLQSRNFKNFVCQEIDNSDYLMSSKLRGINLEELKRFGCIKYGIILEIM